MRPNSIFNLSSIVVFDIIHFSPFTMSASLNYQNYLAVPVEDRASYLDKFELEDIESMFKSMSKAEMKNIDSILTSRIWLIAMDYENVVAIVIPKLMLKERSDPVIFESISTDSKSTDSKSIDLNDVNWNYSIYVDNGAGPSRMNPDMTPNTADLPKFIDNYRQYLKSSKSLWYESTNDGVIEICNLSRASYMMVQTAGHVLSFKVVYGGYAGTYDLNTKYAGHIMRGQDSIQLKDLDDTWYQHALTKTMKLDNNQALFNTNLMYRITAIRYTDIGFAIQWGYTKRSIIHHHTDSELDINKFLELCQKSRDQYQSKEEHTKWPLGIDELSDPIKYLRVETEKELRGKSFTCS